MTRRSLIAGLGGLVLAPLAAAARAISSNGVLMAAEGGQKPASRSGKIGKLVKPLEEWRKLLSRDEYAVLFEEATERAGSSPLNKEKRKGVFICAACFLPLFDSDTKYESGTGWPSFYMSIPGRLGTKRDWKLILPRTEYHCIRCGGHQGHVFDDGPPPTGERYCNNGLALKFVPNGEDPPPLRT
jgi:peptide-methionine (R)-S-oxide reductase